MVDFIKSNLNVFVSLISIFISFALGRWSKTSDFKKEILKDRYYNFYIPFFTALLRSRYPVRSYSQIVPVDNFEILNLISNNLQYLDVESAELFKDIYFYQLRLVEFSTGKYPENEKYFQLIDEVFDKFYLLTKKESTGIAKKLGLKQVTKQLL